MVNDSNNTNTDFNGYIRCECTTDKVMDILGVNVQLIK
jgi:hypothetical protein